MGFQRPNPETDSLHTSLNGFQLFVRLTPTGFRVWRGFERSQLGELDTTTTSRPQPGRPVDVLIDQGGISETYRISVNETGTVTAESVAPNPRFNRSYNRGALPESIDLEGMPEDLSLSPDLRQHTTFIPESARPKDLFEIPSGRQFIVAGTAIGTRDVWTRTAEGEPWVQLVSDRKPEKAGFTYEGIHSAPIEQIPNLGPNGERLQYVLGTITRSDPSPAPDRVSWGPPGIGVNGVKIGAQITLENGEPVVGHISNQAGLDVWRAQHAPDVGRQSFQQPASPPAGGSAFDGYGIG